MLEHDFHDSIGCWVGMTARAFERALNEELQPHGITFQQWQVLAWLAFEGELSQAQLAQRMRVEAPTLVGILDRMERDSWIERVVAAGDRRKKLIRPLPKVKPVWEKILAGARLVRERAVDGVSVEELQQVRQTLERLRNNLSSDDELHIASSKTDRAKSDGEKSSSRREKGASDQSTSVGSSSDDALEVINLSEQIAHLRRSHEAAARN